MSPWVNAVEAPAEWSGLLVWQWSDGDQEAHVTRMPAGYSREVKHCGCTWFKLVEDPKRPSVDEQRGFWLRMEELLVAKDSK